MRVNTETDEEKRYFYAWKCEKIRATDRPHGRPVKDGCGRWNVKASKLESGNRHLQGNCPSCGRRARLNNNTRRFYTYESRDAANTHCQAMNANTPHENHILHQSRLAEIRSNPYDEDEWNSGWTSVGEE